ncbi:MAG TPA: hypothetical protein VMO20_04370 [Candidatus Acidoferrum sp.]|nr:hypothetical protein [Candidatus Acidoferrum sp.]
MTAGDGGTDFLRLVLPGDSGKTNPSRLNSTLVEGEVAPGGLAATFGLSLVCKNFVIRRV